MDVLVRSTNFLFKPAWRFFKEFIFFITTNGKPASPLMRIPLVSTTSDTTARSAASVEVLIGLLAERYIATLTAANDSHAPRPKQDQ
ncbi:MAG: hypothetical protein VX228_10765 [Pseudomonadota bacterium]|nr:hypothetical protein [Pseudomonadota bacterium]